MKMIQMIIPDLLLSFPSFESLFTSSFWLKPSGG
jgi:hypothetical protein